MCQATCPSEEAVQYWKKKKNNEFKSKSLEFKPKL